MESILFPFSFRTKFVVFLLSCSILYWLSHQYGVFYSCLASNIFLLFLHFAYEACVVGDLLFCQSFCATVLNARLLQIMILATMALELLLVDLIRLLFCNGWILEVFIDQITWTYDVVFDVSSPYISMSITIYFFLLSLLMRPHADSYWIVIIIWQLSVLLLLELLFFK